MADPKILLSDSGFGGRGIVSRSSRDLISFIIKAEFIERTDLGVSLAGGIPVVEDPFGLRFGKHGVHLGEQCVVFFVDKDDVELIHIVDHETEAGSLEVIVVGEDGGRVALFDGNRIDLPGLQRFHGGVDLVILLENRAGGNELFLGQKFLQRAGLRHRPSSRRNLRR